MAAVSSVADGRRMYGMTFAVRAADGRRTMNVTSQNIYLNSRKPAGKNHKSKDFWAEMCIFFAINLVFKEK